MEQSFQGKKIIAKQAGHFHARKLAVYPNQFCLEGQEMLLGPRNG